MAINLKTALLSSFVVISLVNAVPHPSPQHSDQSNSKPISTFNGTDGAVDNSYYYYNSTVHDSSTPTPSQSEISSQVLLNCLCVPYYRCDPGHWEKTEHDHCTRFMYVCCYGSEAVEYAMNEVID